MSESPNPITEVPDGKPIPNARQWQVIQAKGKNFTQAYLEGFVIGHERVARSAGELESTSSLPTSEAFEKEFDNVLSINSIPLWVLKYGEMLYNQGSEGDAQHDPVTRKLARAKFDLLYKRTFNRESTIASEDSDMENTD